MLGRPGSGVPARASVDDPRRTLIGSMLRYGWPNNADGVHDIARQGLVDGERGQDAGSTSLSASARVTDE
jgi:hypothetical protein